jgi:hypothetical protein
VDIPMGIVKANVTAVDIRMGIVRVNVTVAG